MPSPTLRHRLLALLVLAFAAILFFARLDARALWSEEVRWAEIPREMQSSGDWFQPTFNGRSYYDKPLGSYWLVLAAKRIPGVGDETAARLPCAVAGLLGVWLVMLIAGRLFGPATAPLAGLVLATSFSFAFFSRNASTDVETVAGVLAALWIFLRFGENAAYCVRGSLRWNVAFWTIMAFTSLTKGLSGFVLPCLIIASNRFSATPLPPGGRKSWRTWLRWIVASQDWFFQRTTLLTVPSAAAIYLGPFVVSYLRSGSHEGLSMVFRENIRRFVDPVNHRGPIYLYCWAIFELSAPWSVLLPAALWQFHRNRSQESGTARGERFALAFFWSVFIFFTLSASRRSYYLLPILPAVALLVAHLLVQQRESLKMFSRWFMLGMEPRRVAWAMGLTASFVMACIFLVALPAFESRRTRKPFALDVQRLVGSDMDGLGLFHERDVVFYLATSRSVAEFETESALDDAVRRGEIRWVIARRSDVEALNADLTPVLSETVYSWEAENQKRAKLVLLQVPTSQTAP